MKCIACPKCGNFEPKIFDSNAPGDDLICKCGIRMCFIVSFSTPYDACTCREPMVAGNTPGTYISTQLWANWMGDAKYNNDDFLKFMSERLLQVPKNNVCYNIDIPPNACAQKFFEANRLCDISTVKRIYFDSSPQTSWDLLLARVAIKFSIMKSIGVFPPAWTCETFAQACPDYKSTLQSYEEFLAISDNVDKEAFQTANDSCNGIISFVECYNDVKEGVYFNEREFFGLDK